MKTLRRFGLLCAWIGACLCVPALNPPWALADPPAGKGYALVFDDEFDGTSLDTTRWNYNYPWGTTHNGMANMQPSQVTVADGVLTLTAENRRTIWDPWGTWALNKYIPFDYTSGTINTRGKASWHYGYFEGRFQMPWQQSTWPAFWMLQEGWPPELDIFEVQGDRHRDYYTYHYRNGSGSEASFGGQYYGPDLSADWHTFGVEWLPNYLGFYVDDVLRQSFNRSEVAQMGNMYLMIDLQVGGWAPDPTGSQYPAQMQIDWVRVSQIGGPPSGVYQLTPQHAPDKALDVLNYGQGSGTPVDIYSAGYGENQKWSVERQGDGSYSIKAYPDWSWLNQVLDLHGGDPANGTPVTIWQDNGGAAQRWYFEDVSGDGAYRIIPKLGPSKCLEATGGSPDNGTRVQNGDYVGGDNQLWRLN